MFDILLLHIALYGYVNAKYILKETDLKQ